MQKKKYDFLLTFLITTITLTLFLIFASGCGKKTEETKAKGPFTIGFDKWVGFAPFFLAKEKGYFGELQVKIYFTDTETERREGLNSGRFQMICETMDMFQANREAPDYPGKIVFALDESSGVDGVLAASDIKSLKNLQGKKVAAEPGLPAYFILLSLLDKEEMTLKDINFQKMGSKEAADAFAEGKVDVAGTYEPYLSSALKKRRGARILISSDNLPQRIVDVAVVDSRVLKKRSGDLRLVYEGWLKAVDFIKDNTEESLSIMAKTYNMEPGELKEALSRLNFFSHDDNKEYFGTLKSPGRVSEIFEEIGMMLDMNKLTKAKSPASTKVNLSIIYPQKETGKK